MHHVIEIGLSRVLESAEHSAVRNCRSVQSQGVMTGCRPVRFSVRAIGICIGSCIREEMPALVIKRHRTVVRLAMPPYTSVIPLVIIVLENHHG